MTVINHNARISGRFISFNSGLVSALLFPVPARLPPSRRYLVHTPLVLVEAARRREGRRAKLAREQCCQMANFDSFLSWRNPRNGWDQILQRSGVIVQKPKWRRPWLPVVRMPNASSDLALHSSCNDFSCLAAMPTSVRETCLTKH